MALAFNSWLPARRALFNEHARTRMTDAPGDGALAEAMRAGVARPGKRYRPLLMLAVAESHDVTPDTATHRAVLDAALAAECFHAASLVYDDLPCMDNADRRGDAPSMHRALETLHPGHGATLATLVAHSLTAFGFAQLASLDISAELRAHAIRLFADAIGSGGMAGGQADEFTATRNPPRDGDTAALETFSTRACRKTYPLFGAAACMGALLGGSAGEEERIFYALGLALGEAYQLADDLRDTSEDRARDVLNAVGAHPDAAHAILERRLRHAREFPLNQNKTFPLHDFVDWFSGQCEKERP